MSICYIYLLNILKAYSSVRLIYRWQGCAVLSCAVLIARYCMVSSIYDLAHRMGQTDTDQLAFGLMRSCYLASLRTRLRSAFGIPVSDWRQVMKYKCICSWCARLLLIWYYENFESPYLLPTSAFCHDHLKTFQFHLPCMWNILHVIPKSMTSTIDILT